MMKIVKMTVYMEVPDEIAEACQYGCDLNSKAAHAAVDALADAFPEVEAEPTKVQIGCMSVGEVTDNEP